MLIAKIIQGVISSLGKMWHKVTPNKSRKPMCVIYIDSMESMDLYRFRESPLYNELKRDYHIFPVKDGVVVDVMGINDLDGNLVAEWDGE